MFRKMRRVGQDLPAEVIEKVLTESTSGVLALQGDDDYPYAVPLSHVYHDGKLYFHCAHEGHKIDAINRNPKASYCVVWQDKIVAEEYTTYFQSIIAFGKIHFVTDPEEKMQAAMALVEKFSPGLFEARRGAIPALTMFCLEIEHITGKEGKALAQKRKNA